MGELVLPQKRSETKFTGSLTSYPVELFIHYLENEAHERRQTKICEQAWIQIDEDTSFPSGNSRSANMIIQKNQNGAYNEWMIIISI